MGSSVLLEIPFSFMISVFRWWVLGLLLTVITNAGEVLKGKVIKVTDGDTIILLVGKEPIKIRLSSIDAPERSQPYGNASKLALGEFLKDKQVHVEVDGKDRYKRILGTVVANSINVNQWLVQNGWAWQYRLYDKSELFSKLELEARLKKVGLWTDGNPISPWEYRRGKR